MPSASAGWRRCSSRARAGPIPAGCADAPGATRLSTSPAPRNPVSSCRRDRERDVDDARRCPARRGLSVAAVEPARPRAFGPTAAGKSAVAEAIAAAAAEVVSADSTQVYRGLPILTNQSGGAASGSGRSTTRLGRPSTSARPRGDRRLARAQVDAVRRRRHRAVPPRRALRPRPAAARRPGTRSAWRRSTTSRAPRLRTSSLAEHDPAAAARSPERPPPRRARARAGRGRLIRCAADRLWADDDAPSDGCWSGSTSRRRSCNAASRPARTAMFDAEWRHEVAAALAGPAVARPRGRSWACARSRSCRARGARSALVVRTRQYAAYQRKWMRRRSRPRYRAADRPPEEIADEISRWRAHGNVVPRGRAG